MKALALISGGLDSLLSSLLIKEQGIKVQGLGFKSLFFDPQKARAAARSVKIPLQIIDISREHLQIVKNPHFGYGKQANPCLDCHLLMLKKARQVLEKQGFAFIVTGEVLGQRPFSQNKNSLILLEKEANLKGLILRPLCAKLLPATIPEQKGWVKREKLLKLQGRSRKIQIKMAEKYKLRGYSAPGTACILTDPQFSQRLFALLKNNPRADSNDIRLLKLGRHFWQNKILIVVGRNHEENLQLKRLWKKNDLLVEAKSFPGPSLLIKPESKKINLPTWSIIKKLLLKYSPKLKDKSLLTNISSSVWQKALKNGILKI